MAINFPTAPADNTIFPFPPTAPGITYRYKSAAPAYWRDMRGTALRTNRINNPCFQIQQLSYNLEASNLAGFIVADEWFVYYTTTGTWRAQSVLTPSPKGSTTRFRVTVDVADTTVTSGEWLTLSGNIEASKILDARFGTSSARPLILRFGWRSPAGTWNVSLRNRALTRSFVQTFVITAGQANTDTEQIFYIPGDTSGVWATDNDTWAYINFLFMQGNTTSGGNANKWVNGNFAGVSGITNGMAVVGNVFEVFDVGLYVDPNFTGRPPEFEVPDPAEELARCQRYMAKLYDLRGIVVSGTVAERMGSRFPVPMRTVPSFTVKGTPHVYDYASTPVITSVSGNYSSRNFADVQLTTAGGMTGGYACCMYYQGEYDFIWAKAWQT